jgi:hypothetical protein
VTELSEPAQEPRDVGAVRAELPENTGLRGLVSQRWPIVRILTLVLTTSNWSEGLAESGFTMTYPVETRAPGAVSRCFDTAARIEQWVKESNEATKAVEFSPADVAKRQSGRAWEPRLQADSQGVVTRGIAPWFATGICSGSTPVFHVSGLGRSAKGRAITQP